MSENNTHVVLIGIDHYDDRDVTDLRGGRNDVIAWWRLCTRYLHIAPEQITVLASPPLTAAELGDGAATARLGGATRREVVEALQQLAATVAAGDASGLVTFSGHGVVAGPGHSGDEGQDLALCPQDVVLDEGRLDRLVRFRRLSTLFGEEGSRNNVTMVLDTCYTATSADSGPDRGLLGALRKRRAGKKVHDALVQSEMGRRLLAFGSAASMSTRLLLASEHWARAYEIRVGGQWRGAFSWALCTLMEQWSRRRAGEVIYLNVSYGHLLQRATALLSAMGLEQRPVLWGARRLDNLALLRPGMGYEPGETSPTPDGPRGGKQVPVDVGHWVTMAFLNSGDDFAFVVAVGDTAFSVTDGSGQTFTYERDMEYWYAAAGTDLADLSQWSEVSWRCHYSGSYADAASEALEALDAIGRSPQQTAWTASRTIYTWTSGSPRHSYASERSFCDSDSGITIGADGQDQLAGVTIYNNDNSTTWPNSAVAMTPGEEVAFDAIQPSEMPTYHYVFAT